MKKRILVPVLGICLAVAIIVVLMARNPKPESNYGRQFEHPTDEQMVSPKFWADWYNSHDCSYLSVEQRLLTTWKGDLTDTQKQSLQIRLEIVDDMFNTRCGGTTTEPKTLGGAHE